MCASQHRPVFRAPTAADVQISANEAFIVDTHLFSIKGTFNFTPSQPIYWLFHDIAQFRFSDNIKITAICVPVMLDYNIIGTPSPKSTFSMRVAQ